MPPQTTEDLINITGPPEPQSLGKPMLKMNPTRHQQQHQPPPRQSGLMRVVSYLFGSLIRLLNINWLLGLFGLALVELDTAEEIPLNKRKNEDLVENEMKRLKSERECDDDQESKMAMLKDKSNLITDFTNKLWNLTPDINFSEDADVETFLPGPRKVITPTKSFDNLLNFEFSEAETGSADHDLPKLEGEETDLIEEVEEVEEIISYNAEASYRVQVTNTLKMLQIPSNSNSTTQVTATAMQETNHQPEKAESEEQETVLDQVTDNYDIF